MKDWKPTRRQLDLFRPAVHCDDHLRTSLECQSRQAGTRCTRYSYGSGATWRCSSDPTGDSGAREHTYWGGSTTGWCPPGRPIDPPPWSVTERALGTDGHGGSPTGSGESHPRTGRPHQPSGITDASVWYQRGSSRPTYREHRRSGRPLVQNQLGARNDLVHPPR